MKSFGTQEHMLHVAGKEDTCTKEHEANVNKSWTKKGRFNYISEYKDVLCPETLKP